MKKIILIIIIVLLAGAGIYFLLQSQVAKQPASTTPKLPSQQTVELPGNNTVIIKNFSFTPHNLTVKKGTTVTWVNQDSVAHTIKSDSFNSNVLNNGDKFEYRFNEPGTYEYSCGIHPSMEDKIIVVK